MPARALATGLVLGAAVLFTACSTDEQHRMFFREGTGTLSLAGQPAVSLVLSPGSVPYGAGHLAGDPPTLTLDVRAGGGSLSVVIPDYQGAGTYETGATMRLEHSGLVYQCGGACDECTVTVDRAEPEAIEGSLDCSALACLEARDPGGCAGRTIDLSGTFRLGRPADKPLDY